MLATLNVLFFGLHSLLIAFNVVGWAWRRTRPLHLMTLGLTVGSWTLLGPMYGWGYCPCTDWHFQVRRQLGYVDLETSYIQLLIHRLVGIDPGRVVADRLTLGVLLFILVATALAWAWDRRVAGPRSSQSEILRTDP